MDKIRVLLIDDERLAREELKILLRGIPEVEIVGEAANADEAVVAIADCNPDCLLLDIQMPEKTGFDLLEELEEVPAVIFTTAYDQYAIRAFENSALDYLLKPIKAERLERAVARVQQDRSQKAITAPVPKPTYLSEDKQVFLKDGEQCAFVPIGDIYLIESIGNYARVHFGEKAMMIKRSLNQIEERLDPSQYFRANRQELFCFKYVRNVKVSFNGSLIVELTNGKKVEVSTRQSRKLKERMSL